RPDGGLVHREHRLVRLIDPHAVEAFGEVAAPDGAEILLARTWRPIGGGGFQPIEPEDFVEKTTISFPALMPGAVVEMAWFWLEPAGQRAMAGADRHGAPWFETDAFELESPHGPTRHARFVLVAPP